MCFSHKIKKVGRSVGYFAAQEIWIRFLAENSEERFCCHSFNNLLFLFIFLPVLENFIYLS